MLLASCCAFSQSWNEQLPMGEAAASQQQQNQNKIRALAVVETTGAAANPQSSKPVKVYPVLILYKGTYHDASMYGANPEPMALMPATVYEVERAGEPMGLVEIQQPRQQQDSWLASASWVKQNAQTASSKSGGGSASEDDARPTLKRSPSEASEVTSPVPQTNEAAEARPAPMVVHHEASGPPPDPDRPILRRGKPTEEQAAEIPQTESTPPNQKPNAPAQAQVQPGGASLPVHDYAAISDPSAYDTRTLAFPWTATEKKEWSAQLTQIALRRLRQYAQARGLTVSAATPLQDLDIRAFDLFSNNDAQLVITGSVHFDQAITRKQRVPLAPASVNAFITVVVYRDLDGNLQQIFSSITDSQHLDVEGRLQLVDAVDVNGDGRGELLFKRIGADSEKFELYRVAGTQLYKLFEGAEFSRVGQPLRTQQ